MRVVETTPDMIRPKDRIATAIRSNRQGELIAKASREVTRVGICGSKPRTHVHLDDECYDIRFSPIHKVVPNE